MIIRLCLLAALGAIGYWGFIRRSRLPLHIFLVLVILGVAALAVLFPSWTTVVAHWVGVGRGTDLVGYLVDVSLIFIALHYYTKFVDLQRQMTGVVRELAILRGEIESGDVLAAAARNGEGAGRAGVRSDGVRDDPHGVEQVERHAAGYSSQCGRGREPQQA